MSPYSGLTEFFEAKDILKKSGNSLEYISPVTGEVIKMFRKPWNANKDGALDKVMEEFGSLPEEVQDANPDEVPDVIVEEVEVDES
jgi:hypothetical protein